MLCIISMRDIIPNDVDVVPVAHGAMGFASLAAKLVRPPIPQGAVG